MKLFDTRTEKKRNYFFDIVNEYQKDDPGIPYFLHFGLVGSAQWWECFDRGKLDVRVFSGTVSYIGPRTDEFNETEDVVEFVRGKETRAYNRAGWCNAPFLVGDRIRITRTIAVLLTRTGPVYCHIDLWAEWLPASNNHEYAVPDEYRSGRKAR